MDPEYFEKKYPSTRSKKLKRLFISIIIELLVSALVKEFEVSEIQSENFILMK